MRDERISDINFECRHFVFNNKSIGQRAAIISAGPIY